MRAVSAVKRSARHSASGACPRRRAGRARRRLSAGPAWPPAARRRCRDGPRACLRGRISAGTSAAVTAPGQRRLGHVADIGDVGGEHLVIRLPERHPPERVGDRAAGGEQVVGERVVIGEQGGEVGAERDPRGAGQGGEIEDQLRLRPRRARASASPRISRPSASVLPISTVRPLAALQDVAGPEGGARDGILDRRDEQVQADREAGT